MKRHFVIALALLFAGVTAFAVSCNDYDERTSDSPESESALSFPAMSPDKLELSFSPREPILKTIATPAGEFETVSFGDQALRGEVGAPALPTFGVLFAIPQGASVEIEYRQGEITWYEGVELHPMQPPAPDNYETPQPEFAYDRAAYEVDDYFPAEPVFMEEEKIMRGARVANLWITPVLYNPAAGRLGVIEDLNVAIRFIGGEGRFFSRPELHTRAFDHLYGKLIGNYEVIEKRVEQKSSKESGARFLIITSPEFAEAADMLKTWKLQTGMPTEVFTTDVIGKKAVDIKAYIQELYDGDSPPEYILFFGDSEFVPTNYRTVHVSHFTLTGTDLYYACVDGDDNFPDIGIGRISVDTPFQARQRVERIINYEMNPPEDESFYTNAWQFAYFQDDNRDGYADRRFSLTSEEIYQWFAQDLDGGNIEPNRCYAASSESDPAFWNQSSNYHYFPSWWTASAKGVPAELSRIYGFTWSCDAQDIAAAVNRGTFLITHRDHGSKSGWASPHFDTINVLSMLTNADKLPVVFSINCMTGWFDNENDSLFNFTPDFYLCFSEAWERAKNGGAIGVVAPTRTSYSGYNDRLVWGWMDALWPDYIPEYSGAHSWTSHGMIPAMGDVLNYGKIYLTKVYWSDITRKLEVEMFHWFGDPTMKMWMAPPEEIRVDHESVFMAGSQSIEVNVYEDDAVVTLVAGGELIASADSENGGSMDLEFSKEIPTDVPAVITVTKEGYRPYVAEVRFVECAEDADCDDGLWCNGAESCVDNACRSGEAPDCNDDVFCNGTEVCDEDSDKCVSLGDPCAGATCDEASKQCLGDAQEYDSDADDDDDDSSGCGMF